MRSVVGTAMSRRRLGRAPCRPSGRVRIIGGSLRRRLLAVTPLEGLRPTPDRVRETVFNWLGPALEGARCLDLFAGSGALGFECASRGAAEVVMVERHPLVAATLEREAAALAAPTARVVCADALSWTDATRGGFDVIFVDPPFGSGLQAEVCARLDAMGCARAGTLVYVEYARGGMPELPPRWLKLHRRSAGQVGYLLARREADEEAPSGAAPPPRPAFERED